MHLHDHKGVTPPMLKYMLFVAALCLTACSPDDPAKPEHPEANDPPQSLLPTPGEHRVILAADPWCPHNCEAGSETEGYMVDIAREIFAEAGYQLEYRNYGWARTLNLARDNLIDGIIGALKGDALDFVYPEHAVGTARIALYTHPDSKWHYEGLESLSGKTLLVINGYSYSPELDRYIEDHAGNPELVWVISGVAPLGRALKLLDRERTDVFVEDRSVMDWYLRHHADDSAPRLAGMAYTAPLYIAFPAVSPKSEELTELLDAGLARLTDNGRLEAIMAPYGLSLSD
ncbi:substrate-binding periplasmic protein [Marinobacter daepoensis]|nr:transporter substrate-binding domain-containing protein [Marinobacter daepoensis]